MTAGEPEEFIPEHLAPFTPAQREAIRAIGKRLAADAPPLSEKTKAELAVLLRRPVVTPRRESA